MFDALDEFLEWPGDFIVVIVVVSASSSRLFVVENLVNESERILSVLQCLLLRRDTTSLLNKARHAIEYASKCAMGGCGYSKAVSGATDAVIRSSWMCWHDFAGWISSIQTGIAKDQKRQHEEGLRGA